MRAPNGYGTVVKLSGSRRRPWACRITVGWDEGRQRYKYVSYHEDRREAMLALAEYNRNPYDVDAAQVTFAEMYERWASRELEGASRARIAKYRAAYKKAEKLHDMKFKDIKYDALQGVIDGCGAGEQTKQNIKALFRALYSLALKSEVVTKDLGSLVSIKRDEDKKEKTPFTEAEIDKLWEIGAELPLILVYTGMRIAELLEMKTENVNLEERYMVGGLKTKAGRDRVIPIHPRILPLVEKRMGEAWLVPAQRKAAHMGYNTFIKNHWESAMEALGSDATPHATRVTFISRMDTLGAPLTVTQKIVGHEGDNVTTKFYVKKGVEELRSWVEKLR